LGLQTSKSISLDAAYKALPLEAANRPISLSVDPIGSAPIVPNN